MHQLSDNLTNLAGIELRKPSIKSSRNVLSKTRARAVGLFSLGLGLAEAVAPGGVASLIGRMFTPRRSNRGRLLAGGAALLGVAAVAAFSAARRNRRSTISRALAPIHVFKTITINRTPEEVYEYWRNLENLTQFMAHLKSVEVSDGSSTWTAVGPLGSSVTWQAELVLDQPAECIAWRSVSGTTSVPNRGVVRFAKAPGNRGTEVQVEVKYEPPAGALGAAFATLFGEEPSQQIGGDLRRLKQVLETGEVMNSDASIHRGPHPGRPSAQAFSNGKRVSE
jgi:uncharacterized membrane protein